MIYFSLNEYKKFLSKEKLTIYPSQELKDILDALLLNTSLSYQDK